MTTSAGEWRPLHGELLVLPEVYFDAPRCCVLRDDLRALLEALGARTAASGDSTIDPARWRVDEQYRWDVRKLYEMLHPPHEVLAAWADDDARYGRMFELYGLFGGIPVTSGLRLAGRSLRDRRFLVYASEDVDFSGADLSGSVFLAAPLKTGSLLDDGPSSFARARFAGANLERVVFHELSMSAPDFRDASLSGAQFEHCKLDATQFTGATASGLRFETCLFGEGFSLAGATISEGSLLRSPQGRAFGARTSLAGVDLTGLTLGGNWRGASLRGAVVPSISAGTDLANANLRDADLSGADLFGVNLVGARLDGANLRGATTEFAVVYAEQLATARDAPEPSHHARPETFAPDAATTEALRSLATELPKGASPSAAFDVPGGSLALEFHPGRALLEWRISLDDGRTGAFVHTVPGPLLEQLVAASRAFPSAKLRAATCKASGLRAEKSTRVRAALRTVMKAVFTEPRPVSTARSTAPRGVVTAWKPVDAVLLAELAASPDDEELWSRYAEALLREDRIRSRIITLAQEAKARGEAESQEAAVLVSEQRNAWLGSLLLVPKGTLETHFDDRGFLRRAAFGVRATDAVRALVEHPASALLDAVLLRGNDFEDLLPLLRRRPIRAVYISVTKLTTVAPLAALPSLRELHIRYGSELDVSSISKLTGLRKLTLEGVPTPSLSFIEPLRELEVLGLAYRAPEASELPKLPRLRKVVVCQALLPPKLKALLARRKLYQPWLQRDLALTNFWKHPFNKSRGIE